VTAFSKAPSAALNRDLYPTQRISSPRAIAEAEELNADIRWGILGVVTRTGMGLRLMSGREVIGMKVKPVGQVVPLLQILKQH